MNGASAMRLMFAQTTVSIAKYLAQTTDLKRTESEKICKGMQFRPGAWLPSEAYSFLSCSDP